MPEAVAVDPVPDAARRMHEDQRPLLPPPARRSLSRLTASVEKALAGVVLSLAVQRVGEAGCRVHPFDLPRLAPHIKGHAENLGLAERAYLALTATQSDDGDGAALFFDRISVDNWTTFPKASRRAFVADTRRLDPAAGRALIETVWKSEPAAVRAALLEALATGLGPEDKPFLDGLAGDRSESVKQTAAQLLARVPATEGYDQRLAEAALCFKRGGKGIVAGLMKSIGVGGDGLAFALPSSPKDKMDWNERLLLRQRLFGGLRVAELAAATGATADEIVAAFPADEHVILMLLLDAAVTDGDVATARRLVARRLQSALDLPAHELMEVVGKARLTLAHVDAESYLASTAWGRTVQSFREAATPSALKDDGRLVLTAAMMPRAALPAFVATLQDLTPGSARAARDYADLVLALPDPHHGASR